MATTTGSARVPAYVYGVDRRSALAALPKPYALALELADQGADDETIAAAAQVPADAVFAMMEVAEAKLSHLLGTSDPTDG